MSSARNRGLQSIQVRGARQHNLRNLSLEIPRNKLTVVTGLSGSGKSSLAFDTLYAEGQRRYIESLSTYARQFLEQMEKPDVDSVDGLSPAISIEQKTTSRNARSTVGTITEIYDYLRLLFSSVGEPHCPKCHRPISRQSLARIAARILELPEGSRLTILAPVVRGRKGEFRKLFSRYHREGFVRARVDGELIELEDPPELERYRNHTVEIVVDRIVLSEQMSGRVEESVRHCLKMSDGLVQISTMGGEELLFSERLACVDCGIDVARLEPRSFSFNSRFGACPRCKGLGSQLHVNLSRLISAPDRPLADLELSLSGKEVLYFVREGLAALCRHFEIDPATAFEDYPPEVSLALCAGVQDKIPFQYAGHHYTARFPGLDAWFRERLEDTRSPRRREQLTSFMIPGDCPECNGSRLRPESRAVRVGGHSISDYCRKPLDACLEDVMSLKLEGTAQEVAGPVLEEIQRRLRFLFDIGLHYLTLDRASASLSAGEAQRVRLATQVGSQLRGVLYVLDEPSIGLHARDTAGLLDSLRHLTRLGNTVVVVEHDEDTIRAADHVIDLGPGAGPLGGELVAQGSVEQIQTVKESLTGAYLSGARRIEVPSRRRPGSGERIELDGVRHHNLKSIDVAFPLGTLMVVTGVSGAGKSSLVDEVLFRQLSRNLYKSLAEPGPFDAIRGQELIDKVVEIDQSPIGRTPRSNPATYSGVFTPIRAVFALLPESRLRGYKPGRFSFNVKGGRCETCRGDGLLKIEMNFLPDVYIGCEACRGHRYNRETLSVKYAGWSIADVLEATVEENLKLFENFPTIRNRLETLSRVGLGYIRLGQSSTTLSGGEAQRVKLARELSRRATGRTLYILDEPTTGLHFEDVRKLLEILQALVERGNTVIVIEHNLEVIKSADWIIDLGPDGGEFGGRLVVEGTPEAVSAVTDSHTGKALKPLLA